MNVLTKTKSTISETAFDLNNKNNPRDIVEIIKIKSAYFLISRFHGLYKYEDGKFISYASNGIWNQKELLHLTKNNQNNIIVSTKVFSKKDAQEIAVEWRIYIKDSKLLARDLVVEGLSLARTQKEEFSSIIASKGFVGVISALENFNKSN